MKKTVLFLALLLIISDLRAQKRGRFVLQAEANAGILFCFPYQGTFNSIDIEFSPGVVFRYQVGERLGLGIGASYCLHNNLQCLPVFADAKYRFGSGKARPYAEIRTGYAFYLKKFDTGMEGVGYPVYFYLEGLYSQLIVGYSIGHHDFGIAGQLINMKEEGVRDAVLSGGCLKYAKNHIQPAVFLHYAFNFCFRK